MTREEAIAVLTETQVVYFAPKGKEKAQEALDIATEALSTETVQGVGRYENAMQKLRDMPKYLNGVKEKQITKVSVNNTTEKPNDVVDSKNDVVAEPTDLISRADAIKAVEQEYRIDRGYMVDDYTYGFNQAIDYVSDIILQDIPSADRPSGEWIKHNDRSSIIFYYTCSECGEVESGTPPYCRKCGAKMGSDTR